MPKEKKVLPSKTKKPELFSDKEYKSVFMDLKKKIQESQLKAITAVNGELVRLYWNIGEIIVKKQEHSGWGTKFIDKLTKDVKKEFPEIEGFSRTNIFKMRSFYLAYCNCPTAVGQLQKKPPEIFLNIPWGHNCILLDKLKNFEERCWYAQKAMEHGWSRSILENWMEVNLYKREGKAITNFQATLPSPQSDMAQQSLKDPYLFDFLTLHKDHLEKDLEDGLVNHIQKFLLELGKGFSFMGRQYEIEVAGDSYYIDLLFYNVVLRCFFVVELKARPFKPEDAGKLNFYLSAVDDTLKHPNDNPTIGILLCKTRNKVKAEYAFRHINRPMAAIEYETMLTEALPEDLKSSLPTIKEIEAELSNDNDN